MADAELKGSRGWTRRPHFAPGQMLTAEQLNALAAEQQQRLDLLMRGLHGHGVVFGLAVAGVAGGRRLTLSCGLALDRHGRPLHWPGGPIGIADIVEMPKELGRYTLSIHHARTEAPDGGCGPCPDGPDWIEEGVVFSLRGECEPQARECPDLPYPADVDECLGLDAYVCQRTGSAEGAVDAAPDLDWACEPCGKLTRIKCGDRLYDEAAGVPIACVEVVDVADPECDPLFGFGEVSGACAIRPYVYRTPLLFELIRGCHIDLVKVEGLSWQEWIAGAPGIDENCKVPWKDLEARLNDPDGWEITFTEPIAVATLHPGSAFLTFLHVDEHPAYREIERIAALVEPVDPADGFATRFLLRIVDDWTDNDFAHGGRIELTIRGQMLRDRCGNLLDARPLNYSPRSTMQACPGGDFIAVFAFEKRPSTPTGAYI